MHKPLASWTRSTREGGRRTGRSPDETVRRAGTRWLALACVTASSVVLASPAIASNGDAHSGEAAAARSEHSAKSAGKETYIRETAHLRPSSHSSVQLVEEGTGYGTFKAQVKITMAIKSIVTGVLVAKLPGGTIYGTASATPHYSGRWVTFKGALKVMRGTGRYAHASGTTGFYGSIDRYDYKLNVQVIGHLKL